ncbi:MAG: ABC transporter substrate-binding protein [Bradyrhizobium sp.]|nr:ABC transporter substrate-binding protein [Bradyrhizobium sp.]
MNMIHRIGEIVGYVAVGGEQLSVPVPRRWFVRRCQPGRDRKVLSRMEKQGVCGWAPILVRYLDRKTGKPAFKPHLGRRTESPFLAGLIFVPDFEDRVVDELGDYLRFDERVASLSIDEMALLRDIINSENAKRNGRGKRGKNRLKVGDRAIVTSGPFADFAAVIERDVDSRGRLRAFIAALMGGASIELTEAQLEPAQTPPSRPDGSRSS